LNRLESLKDNVGHLGRDRREMKIARVLVLKFEDGRSKEHGLLMGVDAYSYTHS
jgi:hypothetical protein